MSSSVYEPGKLLRESVASGDAEKVRAALTWVLQGDPTFETKNLENAIKYAQSFGIEVYETNNNPELEMKPDEGSWNPQYFAEALTYLRHNFTHERLEHVKKVSLATHQEMLSGQKPVKAQPAQGNGKTLEVDPTKKLVGRRRALLVGVVIVLLAAVALLLFFQKK